MTHPEALPRAARGASGGRPGVTVPGRAPARVRGVLSRHLPSGVWFHSRPRRPDVQKPGGGWRRWSGEAGAGAAGEGGEETGERERRARKGARRAERGEAQGAGRGGAARAAPGGRTGLWPRESRVGPRDAAAGARAPGPAGRRR